MASELNEVVVPTVQIPLFVEGPCSTMDSFYNGVRLISERKHVGNTEQSRTGI